MSFNELQQHFSKVAFSGTRTSDNNRLNATQSGTKALWFYLRDDHLKQISTFMFMYAHLVSNYKGSLNLCVFAFVNDRSSSRSLTELLLLWRKLSTTVRFQWRPQLAFVIKGASAFLTSALYYVAGGPWRTQPTGRFWTAIVWVWYTAETQRSVIWEQTKQNVECQRCNYQQNNSVM